MADQALLIAPDTASSVHGAMTADWDLLRAVMGGTTAMRLAGKIYLPQYEAETVAAYTARVARAVLTNHFEDAIRNVSALPFKRPISFDKVSPDLESLLEDVDLRGNSMHVFSSELFEDAVVAGQSYILIDYPTQVATPDGRKPTIKDVKDAKLRPYWIGVEAESMLACHYGLRNGVVQIISARILEETTEEPIPGVFSEAVVRRVRELFFDAANRPAWRLHRLVAATKDSAAKGAASWVLEGEGVFTLTRLPLVPVLVGRKRRDGTVKPIFLDLAYKQIEHWQSSSDQRNILTASRFPILAVAGAKPIASKDDAASTGSFAFGPYSLLFTEDPTGKWYWVEVQGSAIGAGANDLAVLSAEMRLMGLQPIANDTGNVTATARAIDEARQQTTVQKAALNLEDALNQAISITEEWLGRPDTEASCLVSRDFSVSINGDPEIESLLKMRQSGEISRDTFWTELQRRDVLGPQFDPDLEKLAIESEQPDLPAFASVTQQSAGVADTQQQVAPKVPAETAPKVA